jgi:hypothetical protein
MRTEYKTKKYRDYKDFVDKNLDSFINNFRESRKVAYVYFKGE